MNDNAYHTEMTIEDESVMIKRQNKKYKSIYMLHFDKNSIYPY